MAVHGDGRLMSLEDDANFNNHRISGINLLLAHCTMATTLSIIAWPGDDNNAEIIKLPIKIDLIPGARRISANLQLSSYYSGTLENGRVNSALGDE